MKYHENMFFEEWFTSVFLQPSYREKTGRDIYAEKAPTLFFQLLITDMIIDNYLLYKNHNCEPIQSE